jgi:creatinine amidohydrolase
MGTDTEALTLYCRSLHDLSMLYSVRLGEMTTEECADLLRGPKPVILLPVGSTEPHGPHLPLATDVILSERVCEISADRLRTLGISAAVAPALHYGVTRYAAGFAGAISLTPEASERVLREIVTAYLGAGFSRVCGQQPSRTRTCYVDCSSH